MTRLTWRMAYYTAPLLICSFSASAKDLNKKNLSQCYQAALKRSEKITIQDELLVQAKEQETQAIGAILPSLNSSATLLHQATPQSASAANLSPSDQKTVKLTADQPLFRGLREFAAVNQKKAQIGMQEFAVEDAARQLFYDTATAYYNILTLQSDDANYRNEIDVNLKRLRELQSFVRIGRSRVSEVLTLKANVSSLEAQLESTQGQLDNAKEVFAFLTGLNRDTPLSDADEKPPRFAALSFYLSRIEARPDVKSAAENVKVFEEGVPIARGAHFPSIDLIGDYYPVRPEGLSKGVNWDVQLAATFPIFQGGVIQSQVRQAVSIARQYDQLLSQTRRSAEQEIRQFYDNLSSDSRQFLKLGETVEISRQNYEANRKDYRNGLVTNLDVLQAITTWQDAQRAWAREKYAMAADYVKLQAATGQRALLEQRESQK